MEVRHKQPKDKAARWTETAKGPVPPAKSVGSSMGDRRQTKLEHANGYEKPYELERALCPDHPDQGHRESTTMSSGMCTLNKTVRDNGAAISNGQHLVSLEQADGRRTHNYLSLPLEQSRGLVNGEAMCNGEPMETNIHYDRRQNPDAAFRERMKNEAERLKTYHDFPKKTMIEPKLLSAAGLFFTGSGDKVQCAFCTGELEGWEPRDQPIADHKQYFPDCPFVNGRNVGDIPIRRNVFLENQTGAAFSAASLPVLVPQSRPLPLHTGLADPPGNMSWEELKNAAKRLETFANFPPKNPMIPEKLAEAGFIYLGDGDKTQCVFCKGVLHNWDFSDDPLTEHKKNFQNCGFAHGVYVGNIPISTTNAHNSGLCTVQSPSEHPSVLPQQRALYPEFADQIRRINTFDNDTWRRHEVINGIRIAVAGFFYLGRTDVTQCFYCGGKLRKWEPLDEPWEEHAFHFPDCHFVSHEKGEAFIRDVRQRRREPTKPPHPQTPASSTSTAPTPGNIIGPFGNLMISEPNQGSACSAAPTHSYTFQPKEIKARMDTPTVQLILSKGYAYNDIRRLIEEKLQTTGDDFEGPKSLMEAIITKGIEPNPTLNINEPMEQTPAEMPANNVATTMNQVAISVNSFMNSEMARTAIDMGYPSEAVTNIFEEKFAASGSGFVSVEELIDALQGTTGGNFESQPAFEEPQGATGTTQTQQSSMSGPEPQEMLVTPPSPGSLSEEEMEKLLEKQTLEYQRLTKENTQMKEAKICKICLDEEANIVFLPCGHLVCCPTCAPSLRKCPICRSWIKGTVRVFQS